MEHEAMALFREKLRQLERDIGWYIKSETECCGVSLAQRLTLLEVAKRDETSIVDLASNLGLDTSTLSRTINNLVNLGLVNRVLNPADRRYVSLTLTDQGKKVCDTLEESYSNYIVKIFETIPLEKQQQVVESFVLLADAIKQQQCCSGIINECKVE